MATSMTFDMEFIRGVHQERTRCVNLLKQAIEEYEDQRMAPTLYNFEGSRRHATELRELLEKIEKG